MILFYCYEYAQFSEIQVAGTAGKIKFYTLFRQSKMHREMFTKC